MDLNSITKNHSLESVHLSSFPKFKKDFVDKSLERKMEKAQTISSLVLSLRKKERIKVRQPLERIMIPVLSKQQGEEIKAVEDLIKSEVNVKTVELIDDASDILVKQIKPNFKILGPRFGKDMKLIVNKINQFGPEAISKIEQEGSIDVDINGKLFNLSSEEVEITSQDIEGWLVASSGNLTVALDVHISPELRKEGVARELVNRIQNLRKDSGYEVTDTIDVTLQRDGIIEDAVTDNITYIKNETLTAKLEFAEVVKEGTEIVFDDITTKMFIKKH